MGRERDTHTHTHTRDINRLNDKGVIIKRERDRDRERDRQTERLIYTDKAFSILK